MSDDFFSSVKTALAARAGYACSNPSCRALTSGPQDDAAKAVNIGVAAHITAASVGGPRYDPALSPEERRASSNGIWLCQNCAKLIDNDVSRFTANVLREWRVGAEVEAKGRVGKTAATSDPLRLEKSARGKIRPIIPREHEQSDFMLMDETQDSFVFEKLDSMRRIEIPKSFIEKIHRFSSGKSNLIQLVGRLQWVSVKRTFELFPDKPPTGTEGAYGIGKEVDQRYAARLGISDACFCRWNHLAEVLARGRVVFYDEDGSYLTWGDSVLVVDWV